MRNKLAFGLAAAATVALCSAAPAGATPQQDQTFWDILIANSIIPGPQAVNNAHLICGAVWSRRATVYDAIDNIYYNNDLTYRQSEIFVVAAIETYCPPARSNAA